MLTIEARQQIELPPLIGLRRARALNVRKEFRDLRLARVEIRPLIDAGQKRAAPVRGIRDGQAGTHCHEAGQILILATEAVRQPGTVARAREPLVAGIHQPHALLVIGRVGIDRLDDAETIGMLTGGLLKDLAAPQSAVTVLLELKRRGERDSGFSFGREVCQRQLFAAPLLQLGTVIPCIDLRRPSIQVDMHNMFGSRGEVRAARRERTRIRGSARCVGL